MAAGELTDADVGLAPATPELSDADVGLAPAASGGVGRQIGLGARSTLRGLGSLVEIPADAAAAVGNAPFVAWDALRGNAPGTSEPFRYDPLTRGADYLSDAIGLPRPANTGERIMGGVVEGASGAVIPGAAAPAIVGRMAPGAARSVVGALGDAPRLEAVAGGVGGGAQSTVEEAGGNAAQGMGANLGGALGVAIIAAIARSRRSAAPRDSILPNPDAVTPEEFTSALADPDVQAVARANGITDPADPRLAALQERLTRARATEADPMAAAQQRVERGAPPTGENARGDRTANAQAQEYFGQAQRAVEGEPSGPPLPPARLEPPETIALPQDPSGPPLRGTPDPNAIGIEPAVEAYGRAGDPAIAYDARRAELERAQWEAQAAEVRAAEARQRALDLEAYQSIRPEQVTARANPPPDAPAPPAGSVPGAPPARGGVDPRAAQGAQDGGAVGGGVPAQRPGVGPAAPAAAAPAGDAVPAGGGSGARVVGAGERVTSAADAPGRPQAAPAGAVQLPTARPEGPGAVAAARPPGGAAGAGAGAAGGPAAVPTPSRAQQQIARLTRNGEPAPGTPAARQLARLRASEPTTTTGEPRALPAPPPDGPVRSPETATTPRPTPADMAPPAAIADTRAGGSPSARPGATASGTQPPVRTPDAPEQAGSVRRAGGSSTPDAPAPGRPPDAAPDSARTAADPPRTAADPPRTAADPPRTEPGQARTSPDTAAPVREDAAPPLISGVPLTPSNVKRFLADPAMNGARKLKDTLLHSTAARTVGDTTRYFLASNRATMRTIAERYPKVKEVADFVDQIASDPGSGRRISETYQTAADTTAKGFANRLRNMVGDADGAKLRDELTSGRLGPEAKRVRALLDEFRDYMVKAGVDLGYVKGKYFPRMYDADKVLADADTFKADAAALYRKMGLGAADAADAADDWLNRLAGVGRGGAEFGHTPVSTKFTKGRDLPAEADTMMRRWLQTDARAVLDQYFVRGAKAAEFTRRFGRNGEKAEEMFTAMFKAGVPAQDIAVLRRGFESATGQLGSARSGPLASTASWVQTIGTLAVMPRAVLSSLAEGIAIGSRTGSVLPKLDRSRRFSINFGHALEGVATSYAALKKNGSMMQWRQTAELLGITGDALVDMRAAALTDGGTGSQKQQALLTGLFKRTGLHGLTEGQRIAATRIGSLWVRQLADEIAEGAPTAASARRLLLDLGMDEAQAKAVRTWLAKNDGTPKTTDLLGDAPEAVAYRTAIRRFVNEAIQNPEAVDKPALASHPVGKLAYGIASFMYAFARNTIIRSANTGGEAFAVGKGYTLQDRMRFLGPMAGFALLGAMQFGISELRDKLSNWQQRKERDPITTTIMSLSRASAFGTFDPLVNSITSAKYERDFSGLLVGPFMNHFLANLGKMTLGLVPAPIGPNSPNTNNAEHAAVRAFHASVMAPAITAAAAVMPGGGVLPAAYGIGAMALTSRGTGRTVADAVVGPQTIRARTAGGARGGIPGGGGLSSSGGLRAGGGISAR